MDTDGPLCEWLEVGRVEHRYISGGWCRYLLVDFGGRGWVELGRYYFRSVNEVYFVGG